MKKTIDGLAQKSSLPALHKMSFPPPVAPIDFSSSDSDWRSSISAGTCADFDGDGKADPALYNNSNSVWLIACSRYDYQSAMLSLGRPEYIAVNADRFGEYRRFS